MKLTYNTQLERFEFRLKGKTERDPVSGRLGLAIASEAALKVAWDYATSPPSPIWWTQDVYRAQVLAAHADADLRQRILETVQERGGQVPVLTHVNGIYVWSPAIIESNGINYKEIVKRAGFTYNKTPNYAPPMGLPNHAGHGFTAPVWWSASSMAAMKVAEYADEVAALAIGDFVRRRETALKESRAEDSDIEIPVPEGLAPFGFQRAGVAYTVKRMRPGSPVRGVLIGDDMGLGKTIQAALLVNYFDNIKKVLIICPASLKRNWQRELEKWLVRPTTIGIADTRYTKAVPNSDIVIINYEMLSTRTDTGKRKQEKDGKIKKVYHHDLRQSLRRQWDLVVTDECHRLKGDVKQVIRSRMVFSIESTWWLMLTGTPIVNRPRELWNIAHHLAPKAFPDKAAFLSRYCADNNGGGGFRFRGNQFNGAQNLDELQEKLRLNIMVRRRKIDVLKDLPAKLRQVIELPAEGCEGLVKAEHLAFEAKEDVLTTIRLRVELSKASNDPNDYTNAVRQLKQGLQVAFEELSRIRRETAIAKIPMVIDHVAAILSEGHKVILFAHHKAVVEAIAEAFPTECVTFTGDTPMADRDAAVQRFQNDETCRLFDGTIGAAGVGLTLTASSYVVFAELDWVPGNVTQAEDRAHRIGQNDSVLVQHLVLEGSLDKRMADVLVEKQDIADRALDRESAEQVLGEPVTPDREPIATQGVTVKDVTRIADKITKQEIAAVQYGLRVLAGAHKDSKLFDARFRSVDAPLGTHLAQLKTLTPRQAALGKKFLSVYKSQLAAVPEIQLLFTKGEK